VKKLLLSLLWCSVAASAAAQSVRVLSVDEGVEMALRHSREVRIAQRQVDESAARYGEARTLRLPALATQATYQRLSPNVPDFSVSLPPGMPFEGDMLLSPAIHNRYNLQLSVQQPLFTGYRIQNSIRASERGVDVAEQELERVEAETAFRVQEAYWNLFKAQGLREIVERAERQVEAHLRNVRNLREAGLATDSDLLSVQTRQAEIGLKRVEAENTVRLARLNLNHLTGLPLHEEVLVSAPPEPVLEREGVDELV
jgi:outer membrane protein